MKLKPIGLTYTQFTDALRAHGWGFHENDYSWRAKAGDPRSEPAATPEALQDLCTYHPALTKDALALLLAGHEIEIIVSQIGYETTVTLRPSVRLVSRDPDVYARPVKLGGL